MTGEWEIPFTGWEESSERLGVSIIGSLVKKFIQLTIYSLRRENEHFYKVWDLYHFVNGCPQSTLET